MTLLNRLALAGAASILLGAPAASARGASMNTREILLGCRAYVYEQNANFYAGLCFGAIGTMLHLSYDPALRPALKICAAPDATYGQAIRVVTQWLEDHPERQGESFADLTIAAMQAAWPCGK
jgi:hypothetical protein